MKVGPSTHSKGGVLRFGYYMPDAGDTVHRVAMWTESAGCMPEITFTVNLEDEPPQGGVVWLKTWSENDGAAEALELAGVVQLQKEWRRAGFSIARKALLTAAALAELEI
jgi:hypothetical protein